MAVKLKLPPLNKLITFSKDAPIDHMNNYVVVKNNTAFISSSGFIFFFNLQQYYEICEFNEEEMVEVNEVLAWLEGKAFPLEMWDKLTKDVLLSILDEKSLHVDNNGFAQLFIYEDVELNTDYPLQIVEKYASKLRDKIGEFRTCISFKFFSKMNAMKNHIAASAIHIQKVTESGLYGFTFVDRPYMFGFVSEVKSDEDDLFAFEDLFDMEKYIVRNNILGKNDTAE